MLKLSWLKKVLGLLAVGIVGFSICAAPAFAVESATPPTSGITVSPASITAQVGSAQRQATASVGVRNNFSVPVTITAALNGIDLRNNSLLPTNKTDTGLAEIITINPAEITIPPQSSRNITIIVTDKLSLAPGGHYVSLLITQSAASGPNANSQLSLKPAVSAVIYIIKEDGAIRSIKAKAIKLNHSLFSLPGFADVTFYNDGNVASLPRGILTVRQGKKDDILAQAIVNQESVPLYPQQTTALRSQFVGYVNPKLPSRVVVTLDYRPDGQSETKSLSTSSWYVPVSSLILIVLALLILSLLIWPTSRKKFIRIFIKRLKTNKKPFINPDISNTQKNVNSDEKPTNSNKRHFDIK